MQVLAEVNAGPGASAAASSQSSTTATGIDVVREELKRGFSVVILGRLTFFSSPSPNHRLF